MTGYEAVSGRNYDLVIAARGAGAGSRGGGGDAAPGGSNGREGSLRFLHAVHASFSSLFSSFSIVRRMLLEKFNNSTEMHLCLFSSNINYDTNFPSWRSNNC